MVFLHKEDKAIISMQESIVGYVKALQDEQKTRGIVEILSFLRTRGILDMTMRHN